MRRTIDDVLDEARQVFRRLEPREAWLELTTNGSVLVDIRSEDERRQQGHLLPGAVHHPLSVLAWRLDPKVATSNAKLDVSTRVILICREGYSSSLATRLLLEIGFERATDVIGGVERWLAEGLPAKPYDGAR